MALALLIYNFRFEISDSLTEYSFIWLYFSLSVLTCTNSAVRDFIWIPRPITLLFFIRLEKSFRLFLLFTLLIWKKVFQRITVSYVCTVYCTVHSTPTFIQICTGFFFVENESKTMFLRASKKRECWTFLINFSFVLPLFTVDILTMISELCGYCMTFIHINHLFFTFWRVKSDGLQKLFVNFCTAFFQRKRIGFTLLGNSISGNL